MEPNSVDSISRSPITVEQVERAIAELEQSSTVTVDIKLQAIENYRAAIKNLQSAADSEIRLQSMISESESVTERSERMKFQLVELKEKQPSIDPELSLQQLEQLLPTTELQLSGYKKSRQEAEAGLESRSPRRKEIRARLAEIQQKIADATSQLKVLASAEVSAQSHSLLARLMTRKLTLEKEQPALEGELARFDAEEAADLLRLRLELATCNVSVTEKLIALIQQRINSAREAAAIESVRTARREAISADPELKVYAEQNQQLAEDAQLVAEALAETQSQLKTSTDVYEGLVRQFALTRKKVDSVGLTSSVGALLRKQMAAMPDVASRRVAVANRQKLINDTQYRLFELEEEYQEIAENDDTIEQILATTGTNSLNTMDTLASAARDLVSRKKQFLDDLVRTNGQYFDTLIELDTVDQQVIKLEAEYGTYINQRVLWIRSGPALTLGIKVEESDRWLLSTAKWKSTLSLLVQDAKRFSIVYVFALAVIGLLLLQRRKMRQSIKIVGNLAEKSSCLSIGPTLRALWLTSIISLGWPLICLFFGWRLSQSSGGNEFAAAVGQGFIVVALLSAPFEWLRHACCDKGICESHFRWPAHVSSAIRREVKIGAIVTLPIVFISATLASSDGIHERGSIQRIAFILVMCMIAFCAFRLLRPSGVMREYLAAKQSSLIARLSHLIPLSGVALPTSLAALAAAGYYYTAQTLFWRLFATGIFIAMLVVMRSVFYRMLQLRRRYLSIEHARERAAAAKRDGNAADESQPVAGITTECKQADITTHSLQSRNLIGAGMTSLTLVGMWMIWIQVLPALSMIGNYPVWGKTEAKALTSVTPASISPLAVASGPTSVTATRDATQREEFLSSAITMSDLALAILIVVFTFVLFRNAPGLLEMSLLQQLPLEASVRYAITTLVSYVVVMVGTIAACSTIGLQWSQIQWLATALTFGLAFGLQEMFANFVSGLIILLERPIRVGDVVTIDDVTGVVSRIRIRATSITNWDRKEYVVPNKEFITGRLLNWTLTDKVNRITVEVGLAYGSDTEQARELLLQAAHDHPVVLEDPKSVATFEKFGDNSLNLVLRAFIPSVEGRLDVIHELHTAIDKSFRAANIEIAFPQRDLHIRSIANSVAIDHGVVDENAVVADVLRGAA